MKMYRAFFVACVVALLAAGCASGPQYKDMAASIPTLADGQGRIYFFRETSLFGGGIQPEIRVNNTAVGNSIPGAFFYVDEPAGKYTVATKTEVEKDVTFSLNSGETKYVRTSVGLGILVGRITPTLEQAGSAQSIIQGLKYETHIPEPVNQFR